MRKSWKMKVNGVGVGVVSGQKTHESGFIATSSATVARQGVVDRLLDSSTRRSDKSNTSLYLGIDDLKDRWNIPAPTWADLKNGCTRKEIEDEDREWCKKGCEERGKCCFNVVYRWDGARCHRKGVCARQETCLELGDVDALLTLGES